MNGWMGALEMVRVKRRGGNTKKKGWGWRGRGGRRETEKGGEREEKT